MCDSEILFFDVLCQQGFDRDLNDIEKKFLYLTKPIDSRDTQDNENPPSRPIVIDVDNQNDNNIVMLDMHNTNNGVLFEEVQDFLPLFMDDNVREPNIRFE